MDGGDFPPPRPGSGLISYLSYEADPVGVVSDATSIADATVPAETVALADQRVQANEVVRAHEVEVAEALEYVDDQTVADHTFIDHTFIDQTVVDQRVLNERDADERSGDEGRANEERAAPRSVPAAPSPPVAVQPGTKPVSAKLASAQPARRRGKRRKGGSKKAAVGWIAFGSLALVGAGFGVYFLTRDDSDQPGSGAATAPAPSDPDGVSALSEPPGSPPREPAGSGALPASSAPLPADSAPSEPPPSAAPPSSPPSATPPPSSPPPSAPASSPPTPIEIPSGVYNAVTEIAPGAYRVTPASERDPRVTVTVYDGPAEGDIVEVFGAYESSVVMIVPDDPAMRFDFDGVAANIGSTGPVDPVQYDNGRFLVGVDLQPGNYTVSGEYAYWAIYDVGMNRIDGESGTGSPDEVLRFTIPDNARMFEFSGQLQPAN